MAEHSPSRPARTPSGTPSPSENPDLSTSPRRGINPPSNDAWGVESTTAPSYRSRSFAPNPRCASRSPTRWQNSGELSMEEQIDQTIRFLYSAGLQTEDEKHGIQNPFSTRDRLPTKNRTEVIGRRMEHVGMDPAVVHELEGSPKSRKRMKEWGKMYQDQDERGRSLEKDYLRYEDANELRPEKTRLPSDEQQFSTYVQRERAQRGRKTSAFRDDRDLKVSEARIVTDRVSQAHQEAAELSGEDQHHESTHARPWEEGHHVTIKTTNPTSAMRVLIEQGSTKLTTSGHTVLESRVALEKKWAAEDAEWARLEDRRRSQLRQKSLEHRQFMMLGARESEAAEDLGFAVDLHDQVDAAIAEPSPRTQVPEVRAPRGSSSPGITRYENIRVAVEKHMHSETRHQHYANGLTCLTKVRGELDESITTDEGRVEREKQKELADRLLKVRKPEEWKRVQAVRAAEAQRDQEHAARGRFRTWSEEDRELSDIDEVLVKSEEVGWRSYVPDHVDYESTFASPSLPSLDTRESDIPPQKSRPGSNQNSDDDISDPPSPSPKPRRLDQNTARLRDFNIGEKPVAPPTRAPPNIPIIPRGPQPFFGSFRLAPSIIRPPRLSPEQILDKYEASLEEPQTVAKKTKKWDLFAKPIPVLLPTHFGKSRRRSPSPEVPITRSVEYKMTLPDVKMREGQAPEDATGEREHLNRYLLDNDIPFEYQKDLAEKRQAQAEAARRANLTGGRSPTRSPSREGSRMFPTRTSSTRTGSTTEKHPNKQLDTVRKLFTPNTASAVATQKKTLLGRTPKVAVTSTTPPRSTAPGFLSPTKTTLARARPVSSPTRLSPEGPRPSSSPNKGEMVSNQTPQRTAHHTPLHSALVATRLSPTKGATRTFQSPVKDPLKVELAELKFRLQKVETWAMGTKEAMEAAGLKKEWDLLQDVMKSRVLGAGGSIGPSFADWDVEMRLREGLERDD